MGMIDRYKKKGGFTQLLQLIETASPKKQEQFLQIIASESPPWEVAIRQKTITLQRIYGWPNETIIEIFTRLPQLTLAAALHGSEKDLMDKILGTLPTFTRRKIEDTISEVSPTPGEKHAATLRIISDLRGMIHQGLIKLEKIDPDLLIPDNIEETLNITPWSSADSTATATTTTTTTTNQPSTSFMGQDSPASLQASTDTHTNHASTSSDLKNAQSEIDFLKRKVNQLVSEVNVLRNENSSLKDRLDQIKRIA